MALNGSSWLYFLNPAKKMADGFVHFVLYIKFDCYCTVYFLASFFSPFKIFKFNIKASNCERREGMVSMCSNRFVKLCIGSEGCILSFGYSSRTGPISDLETVNPFSMLEESLTPNSGDFSAFNPFIL
ncbi:hypothetical protein CLIB1423_39S00540 [[Candida] railenensis]|uniref:Uncharacterized protein n=1 Tax=[Candida] railenensis TaxID=45579 RepID=A0A9P0QX88_9ASCO|nr:hypothetical protein CLIB1423_39S00540 [[Candida] railenensis]